ncbi:MAG: LysR family transcriptional regulator [Pseudomonadota bacterium]
MNQHLPTDFLRSFVVIIDTGNFTKAGQRLGRSQSAISLQIKKLEEITGHTLFHRQGHNFSLTPQGQTLLSYARQMLALNDQVLDELNPQALSGSIRLGIPSEFATSILPKMLGEFSRNNPQVSLEVSCDLSQNLRKRFDQDDFDVIFSLTFLDDSQPQQQDWIRIDELVWVSAHQMNWQAGKALKQEVQLVLAPEGCLYRQQALQWLTQAEIPWRIVYTIVDISGIQAALQEGIGITVLAKTAVPDHLALIDTSADQPSLGHVGMKLSINESRQSPAILRLAEYIERALQ